jgi:Glycosyl transferase family 11.
MIVMKISGGLGNQLFQYAVGRAIAIQCQVPLKLDVSAYENYKLHNGYRLDNFNINADIANEDEIFHLKGPSNRLFRILRRLGWLKKNTYYAEKQRTIYDASVFMQASRYLDGYWQNEQYFSEIRPVLLQELWPNQPLSIYAQAHQTKIQQTHAVSIHVRRGDYLNHPEIGVLDIDYYKRAVDYIKEKVESPVFFIFSNDLSWCRDNFNFVDDPIFIEDTQTEIDDLMLMCQCQHNIIANSSFSWWAAWLNSKPDSIVIAPKKWRIDDAENYKYLPSRWIIF